ncbi:MAG: GNAT family N-acetyltransferase [Micropruina sp.]|nr:GNAT family N-acetyltransferase [Micropruina sp.]
MPSLTEIYPPFGLQITAGPLELRGIGEAEVLALLALAQGGIHDPSWTPFAFPWTDAPDDELPLNYLQWWWQSMATFRRNSWNLDLAVLWEGEVVGVQGVATRDFLVTRTGETGSWLGAAHQGKGIGTAMRRAFCAFLFDHLEFSEITSAAFADNAASRGVSRKVGYRENGVLRQVRRGEMVESIRLVLAPADFVRGPEITVVGAGPARKLIGLD